MPGNIFQCKFCGNLTSGTLCPLCRSKEQRKKQVEEQVEIEKEHNNKGYVLPKRCFLFDRTLLFKEFKIKL